ncbi:MAG: response regulator, partial [Planctomycetes bacterium]|nr:response regulator [Planctomycetota bacterium]
PVFSRLTGQSAAQDRGKTAIELVVRDGRLVPCQIAVSDWLNQDGGIMGYFLLVFEVDEDRRSEARVRAMEESMAEMEKSRSFFFDMVSRELRAPASGVMSMTRMFMDAELTERQADLAGVIHSSASSIIQLIDDIIDIAGTDLDAVSARSPLRLVDLIRRTANLFTARAEEKGLEIRIDISPTAPERIIGDSRRLRRVLAHLLDDAFKHTEHGHVALSLNVVGDNLRFMVSDTGSGVKAGAGGDLFDGLLDGQAPESLRSDDLEAGFAVCRRLVAAMGGKIGCEWDSDRGSEFHFSIPLVLPAEVDEEAESESPPAAPRLPPLSILLADGNPLSREVVKACLRFDSHSTTLADNGLDAVGKCRGEVFDLILLDLHLPKMDGIQALRLIREDEVAAGRMRVPALFLAPAGRFRDPEEWRRPGADGVVEKPVQPAVLMSAMSAAAGLNPFEDEKRC